MRKVLLITSSIFGADSNSQMLAEELVHEWVRLRPDTEVIVRDAAEIPHMRREAFAAVRTPASQRSAEQQRDAALGEELLTELESVDLLVIAAPMYNLSVSSTLKAWIDHVSVSGRTFRYTEHGSVGLLSGKRVFVISTRGRTYGPDSHNPNKDFQEPYLRGILGLIGLTDVTFVRAEGLRMSQEVASLSREEAKKAIKRLAADGID